MKTLLQPALLLLLLLSAVVSQLQGPSNTPLPPNVDVIFNGRCRLCEINCSQFIPAIFSSCKYTYYRYGCDAKFFCMSYNDLRYYEKYVAVAFCKVENGCQFQPEVNNVVTLEQRLNIPAYLSYVTFYSQPSRDEWMMFLAKRNAYVTQQIYQIVKQYPNNSDESRRLTYLRPLVLSYIHPGPGPLIRFKQGLDLFDIRKNSAATTAYVNRWAAETPAWLTTALKPITTVAEAKIFQTESDWMDNGDSMSVVTPEFFFYKHATAYLDYSNSWAETYRTFTKCNFSEPIIYQQCRINVNQDRKVCNSEQMRSYCSGFLQDLGISWAIEDMRIFIEKTFYVKELSFSFYNEHNRRNEILGRQKDVAHQYGQVATTVSNAWTFLTTKLGFVPDKPKS